jgi:RNA polymerase sigma-70 factor (ECF subfamily)
VTETNARDQAHDMGSGVSQLKGAAEESFRRIFEEEYDYVHHSLRRLGVHTRDLEDLVHDVFVEVYKGFSRYDPARPIRPWLFAFAFRFASTYRRLARHRVNLGAEDDDELTGHDPPADETMEKHYASRILGEALATMSVELRAVFVLYEVDETPMKDISESLGIPVNTAYSRLRLARAAFEAFVTEARAREERGASGREGGAQ